MNYEICEPPMAVYISVLRLMEIVMKNVTIKKLSLE